MTAPVDFQRGRPLVMGILNVTPDSFSDGGRYVDVRAAVEHARRMASQGADLVDVGAESTRPGAAPVSEHEELARLMPVLEALRDAVDVAVSVDTSKPAVMRAAVAAGASMVNDVRALGAVGALEAAAELEVPVCLMHMQGEPASMQRDPRYDDVVAEVLAWLLARAAAARDAGVARGRVLIDPGFGFGKRLEHNVRLLGALERFVATGYPVVVGLSRKSMYADLLGREPAARLPASLAAAVVAALAGAAVVRVHDVAPTVDALRVVAAVRDAGPAG